MKKHAEAFAAVAVVVASLALSKPAAAVDVVMRCAADQIFSNSIAQGRIEWAFKCGYITMGEKYLAYNQVTGTDQNGMPQYAPRTNYQYPSFGWTTSLFTVDVWPAPTSVNGSCTLPSSYNNKSYGKPATKLGMCDAGCYTAEQQILFSNGYVGIKDAFESQRIDLMTLAPGSSLENVVFQSNRVDSYIADIADAQQEILNFETASGGQLRVTTTHPLLDNTGSIRPASEFQSGDQLVRENGQFDTIVSLTRDRSFFGKVYNIAPVTTDPVTNIVIAQGFMNGSSRYQNESLKDYNRSIWRQNLPEHLFE